MAPNKNDEELWRKSDAKKQLQDDILSGKVQLCHKPRHVIAMRPDLYGPWKDRNFGSNYRSLQQALTKKLNRADLDEAALVNARKFHPVEMTTSAGKPRWNGSAAEQVLKQEHLTRLTTMDREALYWSRLEYQVFTSPSS